MTTKRETVGQRLRRLRQERGLSQRDLADDGVSYAYVSRIEGGHRTPSVKALRKLARKLGVTPEYLEAGDPRTVTDDLLDEAREHYPDLTLELALEDGDHAVELHWRREDGTPAAIGSTSLTGALLRWRETEDELREIDRRELELHQRRERLSAGDAR